MGPVDESGGQERGSAPERSVSGRTYQRIVEHYEACLERYGDSYRGVDWPKEVDAETRYRVMLEVVRNMQTSPVTVLDFGCGAAHLYEYILKTHLNTIQYTGLDLSRKFIELARRKFPDRRFLCMDILESADIPAFDYVVMNGVLTEKLDLTFDEMWSYARRLIKTVFDKTRVGLAFNVMSKHVDWERDDLFHLPFDMAAAFLRREVSKNIIFRSDYGLYEYTTYIYR